MTTDPIAAARALIAAQPDLLFLCDLCSEECNCHPHHDMSMSGEYILCDSCGDFDDPEGVPDPLQLIATLADKLEAERARAEKAESERDAIAAVAYENAALLSEIQRREGVENSFYNDGWCACASVVADTIRALTPADAKAALNNLLAEARLEGWRAGREAAARSCVLSGQDLAEGGWGPEGRDMAVMLETRVLALPEPQENSHD